LPAFMTRLIENVDYGISIRDACVKQWVSAGYAVFSLNPVSECNELKTQRIEATIVSTGQQYGLPVVGSMAKFALTQKVDVVIFVNSDCYAFDIPRLKRIVDAVQPDDICVMERLNIDQNSLRPTGIDCSGFDGFIVGSNALKRIDQEAEWKIGDTWWDYWFPLSLILKGCKLKGDPAPLLLHLNHQLNWNFEAWQKNGSTFVANLLSKDLSVLGLECKLFFEQFRGRHLTHADQSKIGYFTFDWICQNAKNFENVPPGSFEELKNRFVSMNARFERKLKNSYTKEKSNNPSDQAKLFTGFAKLRRFILGK
jgi:hypothetical protein